MFTFLEDEGSLSIIDSLEMLRLATQRLSKPACKAKAKHHVDADVAWRQTVTHHSEFLSSAGGRNVTKCNKDWMCLSYKLKAHIVQEGSPDLIWHSSP